MSEAELLWGEVTQSAQAKLTEAEDQAQQAKERVSVAQRKLDTEGTIEAADALREARQALESHELLLESKRATLDRARADERKARQVEEGQELGRRVKEMEAERRDLATLLGRFSALTTQLDTLVADVARFVARDAAAVSEINASAQRVGFTPRIDPIDLRTIRAAVAFHLGAEHPDRSPPNELFAPGSEVARALRDVELARTFQQAHEAVGAAASELAFATDSRAVDWLVPARHPRIGSTLGQLEPIARDLLKRYVEARHE